MARKSRAATGLLLLALAGTAVDGSGLDGLEWLVGGWKREGPSGTVHEQWTRRSDGVFEGRAWRQGPEPGSAAVPLEDLLLAEMGGERFYIAKVAENPYPVAFRLVTLEGHSAVFENPEHDFPQRIAYVLQEDGTLLVTVEGPGGADGSRTTFHFVRE